MRARPSWSVRWALLAGATLAFWPLLSSLGQSPSSSASALTEFQQRQLAEYAPLLATIQQGKPVAPALLFEKVYKPIAFANKRDFERHTAIADDLVGRAKEMSEKSPEKAAEYGRIAALYKQYADSNLAVVKACEGGKSAAAAAAVDRLLQVEQTLVAATRKPVGREWFTPREAELRIMAEKARRKGAAGDAKR